METTITPNTIPTAPVVPQPKKSRIPAWFNADTQSTLRILIAGFVLLLGLGYILGTTKSWDMACNNFYSGLNQNITNHTNQSGQYNIFVNDSQYNSGFINDTCYQGRGSSVLSEFDLTGIICYGLAGLFFLGILATIGMAMKSVKG